MLKTIQQIFIKFLQYVDELFLFNFENISKLKSTLEESRRIPLTQYFTSLFFFLYLSS